MDTKDCELLADLARTKNITKTAQKLYLTQPAISKRIQKMEEELGGPILLRSKKGVVFTPLGEKILPHASAIASGFRIMKEQANACQEYVCGSIQLGCSVNFSQYRLPDLLARFMKEYPHVDIQVTTGQSKNLFHMLQNGEISVAIVRGEFAWDEGTLPLSSEPMCLVCSRGNAGRPLSDYPYIGRHTDSALNGNIRTWLTAHGIQEYSKLYIDNINSCKEMARRGIGWCILPSICLNDFDGYVEELTLPDGKPFRRNTYALCRRPYEELPQIQLFLDALLEQEHPDNPV